MVDAVYAQYLDRQSADIASLKRDEATTFPSGFDYSRMSGLSSELRAKLIRLQPRNLAEAGSIEGMTPAALTLILANIKRVKGSALRDVTG